MERKGTLIHNSIRFYFVTTIVSMFITQILSLTDSIIVGKFINAYAFTAVNVAAPVVYSISALSSLLKSGAKIMMALEIGRNNYKKTNEIFTLSTLSLLVSGILIGVFSLPLSKNLSLILCPDIVLRELTYEYILIILFFSIFSLLYDHLSSTVDIHGKPIIITIGVTLTIMSNIVYDLLFVVVLKLGISGASYATVLSQVTGCIFYTFYIILKLKKIRITLHIRKWGKLFVEIVSKGFLSVIALSINIIFASVCNFIIQKYFGKDAMFVMSIAYTIWSFGAIISTSVGKTFTAIGGLLSGERDYIGIKFLFVKGISISSLLCLIIIIVSYVCSDSIAWLFGAESEVFFEVTKTYLPRLSSFILIYAIIFPLSYFYPIVNQYKAAVIMMCSLIIVSTIEFLIIYLFFAKKCFWNFFPISMITNILLTYLYSWIFVIKSKFTLMPLSLIPKKAKFIEIFNASIKFNQIDIKEALISIRKNIDKFHLGIIGDKVSLCFDEIFGGYINYSLKKKDELIDTLIYIDNNVIKGVVREDSAPFDSLKYNKDEQHTETILAKYYCKNLNHSYSFGQNIINVSWNLDTAINISDAGK